MNDFLALDAPIIGMVHLPALPGAPEFAGDRDALRERALSDATALESGGVDAVMVENFGDVPFYPDGVPKHTVASMTALVGAVSEAVSVPVGVNVLRNDAEAALSVAAATGASFVRVNVHTGARVTDQGVVTGRAHETVRLRERLDADVAVLADVDVKHSAPVTPRETDEVVAETLERGLADGVVVSGVGTGEAVDREGLRDVVARRDELGLDAPVVVGSGTTVESVADLLAVADGAIVGTALKSGEETTNPVDESRVRELVEAGQS
ncbi:BtpA/SgcQ family protein [Haloprofundus sp. MHR1]|uniref:BtpA/SgcQ family protein n=1 Tax=Haloprofundus sp. MHR1 TaxID=2572921 RepID=UPI0010BEE593|nr:BtpA/SgcQ family protein [Haloprofundus sp. MHR1]QCJ48163.1 BtpA/SgcQ family protein [Haloprofundus sp. MHR1]